MSFCTQCGEKKVKEWDGKYSTRTGKKRIEAFALRILVNTVAMIWKIA